MSIRYYLSKHKMRNDSILVLGGLALILFFASSGSRTVAEIEERVLSLDEIFEAWAPKRRQNIITQLMEQFLYKSRGLRELDAEKIKSMTKKDLLNIIHSMGSPLDILLKLSRSVKSSFMADKTLAQEFVDNSVQTFYLLLGLFVDVFATFPGENTETGKLAIDQLDDKLRSVITFSI